MHRVLLVTGYLFLSGFMVLGVAALARAQDKPGSHAASEHPPKYTATIEAEGKEEETDFDLSKDTDVKALTDLLRRGEVVELSLKDRPVNVMALRWELGLWTLVVFSLLLLILRKAAWKPMLEGLRNREESIRSAIEEAHRAREEAQRLREQLQGEMNKAHEKVRDILDEAHRNAQRTTEEMVAKARGEIQSERERLRREIGLARDQALQEIWNQTAQLATLVSAKAIRRELTQDDHRRLIDEALAELRQAGNERQRQVASI
jgi:F-type H+-transporting ATPase subunit b